MRAKNLRTGNLLRPATINRELARLKILFNRFIKDDVLTKNPASRVKFLEERNEQMRVLSAEEEKLYLLAASQPLQDIATFILQTGMRPEEVYRIRRENVNLERKYLFNPNGKTKRRSVRFHLMTRPPRCFADALRPLRATISSRVGASATTPSSRSITHTTRLSIGAASDISGCTIFVTPGRRAWRWRAST